MDMSERVFHAGIDEPSKPQIDVCASVYHYRRLSPLSPCYCPLARLFMFLVAILFPQSLMVSLFCHHYSYGPGHTSLEAQEVRFIAFEFLLHSSI